MQLRTPHVKLKEFEPHGGPVTGARRAIASVRGNRNTADSIDAKIVGRHSCALTRRSNACSGRDLTFSRYSTWDRYRCTTAARFSPDLTLRASVSFRRQRLSLKDWQESTGDGERMTATHNIPAVQA